MLILAQFDHSEQNADYLEIGVWSLTAYLSLTPVSVRLSVKRFGSFQCNPTKLQLQPAQKPDNISVFARLEGTKCGSQLL